MIRNFTVFIFSVIALSSCASLQQLGYDYDIAKDSKPESKDAQLILTNVERNMFIVQIKNRSSKSFKVIWDESSFIDTNGNVHHILKNDQKMINAGGSVPPTMIPGGASIQENLTYADNVEYLSGGWNVTDIVPCAPSNAICNKKENFGKTVTLILTIDTDGKKSELSVKIVLKEKVDHPKS